ncbi:hypothetical protein E2562_017577 [Oryza meyeriana var. granulata]|uniref:Uncharacterized protein n=1 Tax=Oryza meyeriana var. granulata TaxID=110450 RepID=A0A6G1C5J7_9ORYZ|nr:hypothetical protein E2562_017577 [Oryza meyeriana var. granulata]
MASPSPIRDTSVEVIDLELPPPVGITRRDFIDLEMVECRSRATSTIVPAVMNTSEGEQQGIHAHEVQQQENYLLTIVEGFEGIRHWM